MIQKLQTYVRMHNTRLYIPTVLCSVLYVPVIYPVSPQIITSYSSFQISNQLLFDIRLSIFHQFILEWTYQVPLGVAVLNNTRRRFTNNKTYIQRTMNMAAKLVERNFHNIPGMWFRYTSYC